MHRLAGTMVTRARHALSVAFGMPQGLAFLPALTLAAYWFGGEQALLATALVFPLLISIFGLQRQQTLAARPPTDGGTGLPLRRTAVAALDEAFVECDRSGQQIAAIAIALEGVTDLGERHGAPAVDHALRRVSERLLGALRAGDVLARLDGHCYAVALAPMRRADLETLLQIAGRLQDTVREPISLDATTIYLSCSIGFCLQHRSPAPDGEALLSAAEAAMREARQQGPGAIRAFSAEMQSAISLRRDLIDEVARALEAGDIRPWFQPQISTDTGAVTGFEALARWPHRTRGMVPPAEFLPVIEQAGLSQRLTEVILFGALSALRSWDQAGLKVPAVGVNFSSEELRNPNLVDRIRWDLDRFNLAPKRLTIEILETVVSGSDDMVTRNIAGLAEIGCGIDLDDFGTGNTSIASIRRFAVGRLKIDRSFVSRVDQDRDQQNMVAAVLTMAERLNLDTLAEGVETIGEHAMLAQLGCSHVQGFGIARPMPFEETEAWIRDHLTKLGPAPRLGRQTG